MFAAIDPSDSPPMPILVDCPGCHRKLRIPESASGRRGRCPQCGSPFVVPDLADDIPAFLPIDPDDPPVRLTDDKPSSPVPAPIPSPTWMFGFPAPYRNQAASAQRVVVLDIDMPFGSMVSFLFRWTLAALVVWAAFAAVFFVVAFTISLLLALFGLTVSNLRR